MSSVHLTLQLSSSLNRPFVQFRTTSALSSMLSHFTVHILGHLLSSFPKDVELIFGEQMTTSQPVITVTAQGIFFATVSVAYTLSSYRNQSILSLWTASAPNLCYHTHHVVNHCSGNSARPQENPRSQSLSPVANCHHIFYVVKESYDLHSHSTPC